MKNTITQRQAVELVDRYLGDAIAAVFPQAQLEAESSHEALDCSDPTDHGPRGRVIATRGYWLRGVPKERNNEYIDALVRWWLANGFVILTDSRPKDTYVWARNKVDSFDMSIEETVNDARSMSLGATSPCVWPDGTPAPKPGPPG